MNWYKVFYWMTVSDKVKSFFDTASNIFTTFTVIFFIVMCITWIGRAVDTSEEGTKNDEEDKVNPKLRGWELAKKFSIKLFYPFLIISLITWAGYVFTPTKKDCLLIVAGGAVGNFITSDTSARQLPSDVTRYLHLSLKNEISELSDEAKKEIGLQTPKERLIDKVEKLSKEQLIEYLKSDSTLTK